MIKKNDKIKIFSFIYGVIFKIKYRHRSIDLIMGILILLSFYLRDCSPYYYISLIVVYSIFYKKEEWIYKKTIEKNNKKRWILFNLKKDLSNIYSKPLSTLKHFNINENKHFEDKIEFRLKRNIESSVNTIIYDIKKRHFKVITKKENINSLSKDFIDLTFLFGEYKKNKKKSKKTYSYSIGHFRDYYNYNNLNFKLSKNFRLQRDIAKIDVKQTVLYLISIGLLIGTTALCFKNINLSYSIFFSFIFLAKANKLIRRKTIKVILKSRKKQLLSKIEKQIKLYQHDFSLKDYYSYLLKNEDTDDTLYLLKKDNSKNVIKIIEITEKMKKIELKLEINGQEVNIKKYKNLLKEENKSANHSLKTEMLELYELNQLF